MRWLGAGVLGIALVLSSCTSAGDEAVTTSITIDASEAVVHDDAILRYGLSTSPSDPWVHYRTSCDTSCGVVFGAITDTLFATAISGETVGLLVEEHDANNDDTIHTWQLREGVTFSDGTELNAEAAKLNIDACRHSALTGPSFAGIDDVRAEGHLLTITTLAPWGNLSVHFAETPCGHMFSGAWLRSLPDLPMRSEGAPFFDPAIAGIPPVGDPTQPVGLGAFVMTSFVPGNGNSTLLERNETYWRGPAGITGERLPRAEEIELVVLGDDVTRRAGLQTGQFDLIHSRDAAGERAIAELGPAVSSEAFAGVVHVVMNAAADEGNPLALVSCRRAIDRSIDRSRLSEAFGRSPSNGPFFDLGTGGESSPDGATISGGFDPVAAAQWGARCIENHGSALTLRLLAPVGDERAELIGSMVERAIGVLPDGGEVQIEVVNVESGDLALAALLGDYDLLLWEGFAGVHPDLYFTWWYGEAAAPVGSLSTNVGRIDDPALDRALVDLRRASDVDESDRAINEIQRAFEAGAHTSWLTSVSWTIGFNPLLDPDLERRTPDGIQLEPIINGVHSLHRLSES